MHYWLVMPAAGSGRRFGTGVPKQYLPVAGATVIEHALEPFLDDPRCEGIVVALDARDDSFIQLPVARHPRLRTVAGGARRCDSVRLALAALEAPPDAWVLVHDAARPCLPRTDIDRLLAELGGDAIGGILGTPVADTLKRAGADGRIADTPERTGLWRALTPQMFRLGLLSQALREAQALGREPTDEAQAVEWLGHAPRLVAGSAGNLKVTMPADLVIAGAVLAQRSGG